MTSSFDLVIRNAEIVDGTGAERARGELAVRDGRIAAIGQDLAPGDREVDAGGRVLAPGIIDAHTHYDAQVTWDPMLSPSPALGVTTVLVGNCGFTIAPCRADDRELTMRNLVKVEGMSLDAMRAGISWDFETFPQYMDMLSSLPLGPNLGAFVGHSSVRTYVMGREAREREASDAEESGPCVTW